LRCKKGAEDLGGGIGLRTGGEPGRGRGGGGVGCERRESAEGVGPEFGWVGDAGEVDEQVAVVLFGVSAEGGEGGAAGLRRGRGVAGEGGDRVAQGIHLPNAGQPKRGVPQFRLGVVDPRLKGRGEVSGGEDAFVP
jgi:hypothetical protein